jgi:hypothetical protein
MIGNLSLSLVIVEQNLLKDEPWAFDDLGRNAVQGALREVVLAVRRSIPTSGEVEGLEPGDVEWLRKAIPHANTFAAGRTDGSRVRLEAHNARIDRILSALSAVPGRIDLEEAAAAPHADRGVEEPGLGWKLSDKAKAEIDAIEEAQRQGARNAHNIIVGAAHPLPSTALAAANQNPSDVKPPVVGESWDPQCSHCASRYSTRWEKAEHEWLVHGVPRTEPLPVFGGAQTCGKDRQPCYVGADTDDAHWRCGTVQCGLATPSPREAGLREALESGFCTTTSWGNPDPEKRKAAYQVEFRGGDAVDKLHRLDDAVRAIMGSAR